MCTIHGGRISGNRATIGGGISSIFRKLPNDEGQSSGIIYGSEATGVDADGIPLRNSEGAFVLGVTATHRRCITAWETDQIDTPTNRGLSFGGNVPFEQ